MPKISIIVAVYNVEKYIEKCLESLANQTLKDIEIIIVNDGSNDNSINIIKKYQESYKNKIKYFEKENGGLSDARNYGMKFAQGEYIAFVDSDDYIEKDMYAKLYAEAENADIAECNFIWEYPNKNKVDLGKLYLTKEDYFIYGRVMACNKIFKADIIKQNHLQFTKGLRYEDLEFFYKLIPYINKIKVINSSMYHYVQRENSIINCQNEKTADVFIILENIVEFYKKQNIYEHYKQELEYLYIRILLGSSFLRIRKIKEKEIRKELLQKNWQELNTKFPNWKANNILKSQKNLKNLYYKTLNSVTYKIYSKIIK